MRAEGDAATNPKSYGLRTLAYAWAVLAGCAAVAAITLQILGPPQHQLAAKAVDGPVDSPIGAVSGNHAAAPGHAPASAQPAHSGPVAPDRGVLGGPIAPADRALSEDSINFPGRRLPRISPDHRLPMVVYAAASPVAEQRPRIGVLVGGIGQSESDTADAAQSLPASVSFIVSPYTMRPAAQLDLIRAKGHEMFLGLPMEPQGYPVNDEGNQALLTGSTASDNALHLEWAMTRIEGYVGASNALDGQRGDRFSASTQQMLPVLQTLQQRGLMFIDAGSSITLPPSGAEALVARGVDVVLDQPAVHAEMDRNLERLETAAREHGSAIGLVSLPRPIMVSRIASWASGLADRGLVLVPVSGLLLSSATRGAAPAESATEPGTHVVR